MRLPRILVLIICYFAGKTVFFRQLGAEDTREAVERGSAEVSLNLRVVRASGLAESDGVLRSSAPDAFAVVWCDISHSRLKNRLLADPGMVPGMRKCRITRHSGCFLTVVVILKVDPRDDKTLGFIARDHTGPTRVEDIFA